MEISYQDINRKTIDRWVDDGWEWGKPISREVYAAAKNGQWDVKLTPVKFVPHDWFGDLKDRRWVWPPAAGSRCPSLPRWAPNAPCSTTRKSSWSRSA